ncbi:hypothetical protein WALSEDRAFT_58407 [Wallemia mellicola CBS 633.66]|uniref:Zn(2)-C6 fungal-type domain-containing protein n=1 Tax=Wallemia mellicola (strain ATCC MYA-4683 / CBS 633.66) TaxID=671144 RepID=I4Y7R6_WALMC|nr:hypothetical protein WALSEDRAFT_58407 [Wallemia mellicola CBS 633.66]EIM20008.1 hypothetical protein WALSEDRAFT_58407 [Wallemia mellicola CBS 633.66]TIB73098.1 hypothetical protein E3Q23_03122 [Wallemia mellicola]|eukprot:XP_006959938.1 hypothetical protein WALSEDRAFT_58407 [Wallemia mellicola CBS 633.66]
MPKTLPRGSACLACRRKKTRCDGSKPICGNCVKSGGLECVYDDEARQSVRRMTKLRAYEERIRDLEMELQNIKLGNNTDIQGSSPGTSNTPLNIASSSWPKDFPPRDMALYLINIFYSCAPFASSDISKTNFESRLMHLPANSPQFPSGALCHAIFATAYQHLPNKTPGDKHSALAMQKMSDPGSGPGLMFVLERILAAIILSQHLHAIDNKSELYIPAIFAARGVVAFSLNHDNDYPSKWFLKEPKSDLEAEERRRLYFKAYIIDQLYSSDTGISPNVLHEDHIFTPLPCPQKVYQSSTHTSTIPKSTEYVHSPVFFLQNSSDGLSLLIKATILLGRVNIWHMRGFYDAKAANLSSPSQLPSFIELDTLIQVFRQAFPQEYSDPVRIDEQGLDVDNLAAHMVAVECMLSLHRVFKNEPLSQSRLLFFSRVAVNSVYRIKATSYDTTRLPSFLLMTYSKAASVLIDAYVQARTIHDEAAYIENELLAIGDLFQSMSKHIPAAATCLGALEDKAVKAGLQNFSQMLSGETLSLPQELVVPVSQQPTSNWISLDTTTTATAFDDYDLLSGASFTITDENRWLNNTGNTDSFDSFLSI